MGPLSTTDNVKRFISFSKKKKKTLAFSEVQFSPFVLPNTDSQIPQNFL
jgi:hypothetical protein